MNDRINKTIICSIVFLDMIDYSIKPDAEQIDVKNQFNKLINFALKDVAQNDRIIVDTGDGAAIACSGSPEDALFIALAIRDEIIKTNVSSKQPLFVRFGINLGTVRVMNDINSQPNIIGDGINVAQRIMSFAQPNQILVSRSYFEITSRLSQEIAQLFDYSGIKQDKHVRDHEVYSVRLKKDVLLSNGRSAAPNSAAQTKVSSAKAFNWTYAALAIPLLAIFAALIQLNAAPISPAITLAHTIEQTKPMEQFKAPLAAPALTPSISLSASTGNKVDSLMPNETIEKTPDIIGLKQAVAQINNQDINQLNIHDNDQPNSYDITQINTHGNAHVNKQAKLKPVNKKAIKKSLEEYSPEIVSPKKEVAEKPHPAEDIVKPAMTHPDKVADKGQATKPNNKSAWQGIKDSVANGSEKQCTQAQIAMSQCH